MGILNLFRRRIKDPELCRLRDLLAIVYASGEMTTKERSTILEITTKHNISNSKFHQMLEMNPDSVQDAYPITQKEKDEYLHVSNGGKWQTYNESSKLCRIYCPKDGI